MQNKKMFLLTVMSLVIICGAFGYTWYSKNTTIVPSEHVIVSEAKSPKDATYSIDSQQVTLANGLASIPAAPGSASMITTRYFGNEVIYDFDGDGRLDTAFLLTQNTGGSGTFYYIVVALNTPRGYVGSAGYLLGDRISPQTTELSRNASTSSVIIVNYADRKEGESFAIQPSIGKSIWLKLNTTTMSLDKVTPSVTNKKESGANTLTTKTWKWINTSYNNDTIVAPKVSAKFALTFKSDKTFSASTDCNGIGGEYITSDKDLTFAKMISTMMYCESSQESEFTKMLSEVNSYLITPKGELVLLLKYDSGSMIFK